MTVFPAVGNYFSFFYPLGNTPAISLTRNTPPGVDADALLLGCGDLRNILFTVHQEDGGLSRQLDFTCCDYDVGVIARNIFLLSFLVDNTSEELRKTSLWDIYCHIYIDHLSLQQVVAHTRKLLAASVSLGAWNGSPYGSTLRFCDSKTLEDVRGAWVQYEANGSSSGHKLALSALEAAVAKSKSYRDVIDGANNTGALLSAAPALANAAEDVGREFDHFWKSGVTSTRTLKTKRANPLFGSTLSPHKILHYGTDPVAGFHLATGFSLLEESSPLRPDLASPDSFKSVQASRAQFDSWIIAIKKRLVVQGNIIIRHIAVEALSFCHTLQATAQSDGELTANLYRCPLDPSPLVLEETGPRLFDVVDTSNVSDHYGLLNVLIAAAPLMKDRPWACLNSECILKTSQSNSHLSTFEDLVCTDPSTLFLLLGISPLEYWSNATSMLPLSDLLGNLMGARISPLRLVWVKYSSIAAKPVDPVYIDPKSLVSTLFQVYKNMFKSESLTDLFQTLPKNAQQGLKNISYQYPHYHRGGFVAFLKYTQGHIATQWDQVYEYLTQMIFQDRNILIGNNLVQELESNLALQGVHQSTWLTRELPDKTRPAVSAVTLVIPQRQFKSLYTSDARKKAGPVFQVAIQSSSHSWTNIFAALHLSLGSVKRASSIGEQMSVDISQSGDPWNGDNTLVVSFYAPTAALLVEPETALISLQMKPTATAYAHHSRLGLEFKIFETTLGDRQRVFITRYLPGQSGYPIVCGRNTSPLFKPPVPVLTGNVDALRGRIVSITGRIDLTEPEKKKLLADKVPLHLRQSSPSTVEVVFESQPPTIFKLFFPVPVDKTSAKTRIARKSGYVEIVTPIAEPHTSDILSNVMYPTVVPIEPSYPLVALNIPHLRLDGLPILHLSKHGKNKEGDVNTEWLGMLPGLQFTPKERQLRRVSTRSKDGITGSVRVNFKDTIFTMFVFASGHHKGKQADIFMIKTPGDDIAHMLIFIRCIRLDGAAGSVILDAAMLPMGLGCNNTILQSYLESIHTMAQVCQVNVDDRELIHWKQVMPALAERCRTWEHHPEKCEYRITGRAPTSTQPNEAFICSCGQGKGLDGFVPLPGWDIAAKVSTRIGISPTFGVSIVEDMSTGLVDMMQEQAKVEDSESGPGYEARKLKGRPPKCRKCGDTEAKSGGGGLKMCGGCKSASYCSTDCQRADWKDHKGECKDARRHL